MGSEETRLLGKACKCFSRNPAQVNDLSQDIIRVSCLSEVASKC